MLPLGPNGEFVLPDGQETFEFPDSFFDGGTSFPELPDFLLPGSVILPSAPTGRESSGNLGPNDIESNEAMMAGAIGEGVSVQASGGGADDEDEPVEANEAMMAGAIGEGVSVQASGGGVDDAVEPVEANEAMMAGAIGEGVSVQASGGSNSVATSNSFQIFIKAKKNVLQDNGTTAETPAASQQVKLTFPPGALPLDGTGKSQDGFDADPVQGTTDDDGQVALAIQMGVDRAALYDSIGILPPSVNYEMDVNEIQSFVVEGVEDMSLEDLIEGLPDDLAPYTHQGQLIGGIPFVTVTYPATDAPVVDPILQTLNELDMFLLEENFCRTKQAPNDPSFVQVAARGRSGSWGQPYDDQWAIKRVGLTATEDSAWDLLGDNPASVLVAVIDTGLDWNHLDISWDSIWKNPTEIPNNRIDDDGNGYVDDIIGWDFQLQGNLPWDYDGHGTVVAGIIAATQNNEIGIAGINPYAKLMVLKTLNAFGNSRASYIAESIVYAADNGARVVNISVGGEKLSRIERAAVDYANEKGVLIIAAAGNEGQSLEDYGPAGLPGVVTVSATDLDDARTIFSNWGKQVDVAAPGIDVLSLRARRTDTMLDIPDVEYLQAANYVGDDKRYYRVSGTSFAAPIVTGIASLVLSKEPGLTREELQRIITQSADDTDVPGKDQFTGFGIVNAAAALSMDRDYFVDSLISGASVLQQDEAVLLAVSGTTNANDFERAWIEIGAGQAPTEWKRVTNDIDQPVVEGMLGTIPAAEFAGSTQWVLRLITEHADGSRREAWFQLTLG